MNESFIKFFETLTMNKIKIVRYQQQLDIFLYNLNEVTVFSTFVPVKFEYRLQIVFMAHIRKTMDILSSRY